MFEGERLVWAAAAIALVTAFVVKLVITYARHTAHHGRDGHDTRLFANVLALGLLDQSASSVANGRAHERVPPASRAAVVAGRCSEPVFAAHASADEDPVVVAAAARAEACDTAAGDADATCTDSSEAGAPESEPWPYTLGVRFGRIPRT